jgi:hypothetical protein
VKDSGVLSDNYFTFRDQIHPMFFGECVSDEETVGEALRLDHFEAIGALRSCRQVLKVASIHQVRRTQSQKERNQEHQSTTGSAVHGMLALGLLDAWTLGEFEFKKN